MSIKACLVSLNTYLGMLGWFSGDSASCLKTVSEGKASKASL